MARFVRIFCASVLSSAYALCFLTASPAQDTPVTSEALNTAAIQAYKTRNYADFLANEKRALALDPANPRLIYNVACGEALTGNAAEAVRRLDDLVARELDLGAETDNDFVGIKKTPEWAAFQSKLVKLRTPLVHSTQAFELLDKELIATGVAVDR